MIIKNFELKKLNKIDYSLILLYGENEGFKQKIINDFFIKSFDGEIAPKVVEMEGLQVKLEGNIQNQFDQWQTILVDIYESESSQTNEFEIL